MADEQFDFLARFIHAVIGALVGVPVGLAVAELFFDSYPVILIVAGTSLLIGIVAFFFGDSFWRSIGQFFSNLTWWT